MNIVSVDAGRIDHGGAVCDTDLEDGWYVHGDYGDGVIAGPFDSEGEADEAMRDMESPCKQ